MRTMVTLEWLESIYACDDGIEYYKTLDETNLLKILERCILDDNLDYANWLIARCMDRKQRLRYALYAAESVLHIYENEHLNDNSPRMAIEAVKAVIKRDSKKNRDAAHAAAHAAAHDAARVAASAAYAAAWAASYAAQSAAWAAHAARGASHAASYAAAADDVHMTDILRYGIEIIQI